MDGSLWLLFFLNIADITLTKYLVDLGAVELNPIIAHLLEINFVWALLFKLAMVGLFILVTRQAVKDSPFVRKTVYLANAFFMALVAYQLLGVFWLA